MGLTWGQQGPGGPHVGLVYLAIWVVIPEENTLPDILQEARISEMALPDCKEKWHRSKQDTISDYHLCVGGILEGAGSCVVRFEKRESSGSRGCHYANLRRRQ